MPSLTNKEKEILTEIWTGNAKRVVIEGEQRDIESVRVKYGASANLELMLNKPLSGRSSRSYTVSQGTISSIDIRA